MWVYLAYRYSYTTIHGSGLVDTVKQGISLNLLATLCMGIWVLSTHISILFTMRWSAKGIWQASWMLQKLNNIWQVLFLFAVVFDMECVMICYLKCIIIIRVCYTRYNKNLKRQINKQADKCIRLANHLNWLMVRYTERIELYIHTVYLNHFDLLWINYMKLLLLLLIKWWYSNICKIVHLCSPFTHWKLLCKYCQCQKGREREKKM